MHYSRQPPELYPLLCLSRSQRAASGSQSSSRKVEACLPCETVRLLMTSLSSERLAIKPYSTRLESLILCLRSGLVSGPYFG